MKKVIFSITILFALSGAILFNQNNVIAKSSNEIKKSNIVPKGTSNIGQCFADCASEQGICMGGCAGDGQCLNRCGAAHGRCVSRCN